MPVWLVLGQNMDFYSSDSKDLEIFKSLTFHFWDLFLIRNHLLNVMLYSEPSSNEMCNSSIRPTGEATRGA